MGLYVVHNLRLLEQQHDEHGDHSQQSDVICPVDSELRPTRHLYLLESAWLRTTGDYGFLDDFHVVTTHCVHRYRQL